MTKIETSTFLVKAIVSDIKNRIERPIPGKELNIIFNTLERAQKICAHEKTNQEIITLYGKVVDAFNQHIEEEIQALKKIKNKVLLEKKIASLKKSSGISRTNLATLNSLKEKNVKRKKNPKTQILFIQDLSLEEAEETIGELFEIANSLYHSKKNNIKDSLQNIPKLAENKFLEHVAHLKASAAKNKLLTLQALFATAYELAEKPYFKYPTKQEIKIFFDEKEEIMKNDENSYSHTRSLVRLA